MRLEGDSRDLGRIVESLRGASAHLHEIAGVHAGDFPPGEAHDAASTGSRLDQAVAAIGAASASLQAMAHDGRPDRTEAASSMFAVGLRLREVSGQIASCGSELMALVAESPASDAHVRAGIEAPLTRLLDNVRSQSCCVSVIGQMKAGKSSLVNAFTGQPELLPTGVNPWTGVITRLHFGDAKGRTQGADFHFFGEPEWRRLIVGGGRVRELTQKYVPGFDEAKLREQIDNMRWRVKRRLGPAFDRLLGQHHGFSVCGPDLLQRYVCAGSGDDVEKGSQRGEFSDLTRLAEVYFPQGRFAYPAVVMDTPGTNDPFLVRDEITRQSLLTSDIHVVVLTAQQALTMADLSLLRILHGLQKSRIVIFINRIDQLNDVSRDVRGVVASVSSWMRREFPAVSVPVLCGSALWADAAQRSAGMDYKELLSPQFAAFAESIGAANARDVERWSDDPGRHRAAIHDALAACSGLPKLAAAVSGMMMTGPQAQYLKQACDVLRTLSSFVETAAAARIGRAHGAKAPAASGVRGRSDLAVLPALAPAIRSLIGRTQGELEELRRAAKAALSSELETAAGAFIHEETARLDGMDRARDSWRCDSHALRRKLEEVLTRSYDATKTEVMAAQGRAIAELRRLFEDAGLDADVSVGQGPLANLYPPPAVAALGKTLVIDMSGPWWSEWLRNGVNVERAGETLHGVLRREIGALTGEIVTAADVDFKDGVASVIARFLTLCGDLVEALHADVAVRNGADTPIEAYEGVEGAGALRRRLAKCRSITLRLRDAQSGFPN